MSEREVSVDRIAAMRADLDAVRTRIAEGRFDGSTDDGYVRVTVNADGRLLDLGFDPRAFRHVDSEGFRESVLFAYGRAFDEARRRAEDALRSVLGPDASLDAFDSQQELPRLLREVGRHLMSTYGLGGDTDDRGDR